MDKKEKKFLLFLFLGAVLIRTVYLYEISGSPYFGAPFLDELYNLNKAQDFASGIFQGKEAFFRAPLYAFLLGIFIRIFSVNFYLIRIFQHLLGACGTLATYFLARRMFSKTQARIAGVLAACYAPLFFFEGEMLDIFLQFLLYPLILIQCLKTLKAQSVKNNLFLGILTGISALARPNIFIFLPFLFLFYTVFWLKKRDWMGDVIFRLGFICAGMILAIFPATLHNYKAEKRFIPIASYGGINFYIGNNARADGFTARTARRMFYFGRYQDSVAMFSRQQAKQSLGKADLNSAEISRFWFKRSLDWIIHNPVSWARLLLKKSVLFFNNHEIKNNKNIYFVTRYSRFLRFFLAFVPFSLIGSLGTVGLVMALMGKRKPEIIIPALFFGSYTLGVILFFVSARYRAPALTVLIPFAAFALTKMWDASGKRNQGILFAGMGGIVLLMLFSFVDWYHVKPKNYSRDFWSVGNCYFEKGNLAMAEKHFLKALEIDPNYDEAMNNLGETLYAKEKYAEALSVFKRLVKIHPEYVSGKNNLGAVYEKLMMYDRAEFFYREAIKGEPNHVRARVNLAEVLIKQGRKKEALKELNEALRRAPEELKHSIKKDERFLPLWEID